MKSKKEKIITILGTRPEIIRLSEVIPKLDLSFENILIHTGQNYDYELDKIFFKNFQLRRPNYYLRATGSFGSQLSTISKKLEQIILKEKPNKFLVLGDTNSSLGAIIAARNFVKVFHMEAGNRCYDKKNPEEINRKIIDHVSDINLPYTNRSSYNLIKEGVDRNKIYVTGNPIYEVIKKNWKNINLSKVLSELKLINKYFFLITLHRQENVDSEIKLRSILKEIDTISKNFKIPVIWPIHPRTRKNLIEMKINIPKTIVLLKPLGFFDFVNLEIHSKLIFTDSGTVQEEALIFKKMCIILRDTTERPETIEAGSGILYKNNLNNIIATINHSLNTEKKIDIVEEYFYEDVSNKIINIMHSE